MVPFLTLVSSSELNRNPTVKDEIQKSQLTTVNAGMLTYPVHQAVDILFCKGNVVPVGKDQLPHLEIARLIAKRFNKKFCPSSVGINTATAFKYSIKFFISLVSVISLTIFMRCFSTNLVYPEL